MNDEKLRRLIISENDLRQAKQFAEFILNKKLHTQTDEESELVLSAFNTALVVSYLRPFKKSNSSKEHPADRALPNEYLEIFTEDEHKLHIRALLLRDQEHAHSDAVSHSVKISHVPIGIISTIRKTGLPLTQAEIRLLLSMIEKLLKKMILERLDDHD